MKTVFQIAAISLLTVLTLAGCGHESSNPNIAIINLSEVAEQTSQDEIIRQRAEEGRAELMAQLQQLAQGLDQQIAQEAEKAGPTPTPEQEAYLQQLNMQARARLNEAQAQAQGQAAQMEQQLINEFREEIMPIAKAIADERGMPVNSMPRKRTAPPAGMLWIDEPITSAGTNGSV